MENPRRVGKIGQAARPAGNARTTAWRNIRWRDGIFCAGEAGHWKILAYKKKFRIKSEQQEMTGERTMAFRRSDLQEAFFVPGPTRFGCTAMVQRTRWRRC
jgi:hypothetical protein